MRSFTGEYTRSGKDPVPVTVLVFEREMHIGYRDESGGTKTEVWSLESVLHEFMEPVKVSSIRFAGDPGAEIRISGHDAHAYIMMAQREFRKPWYRKGSTRDWGRMLLIISVAILGIVMLYLLVVPALAEKLATRVSAEREQQFGEAVYSGMSLEGREDKEASLLVSAFFAEMGVNSDYTIRVSVVRDETVNAFALPGGRIVIFDALLKKLDSYPELAALLAHEFIHISNQHATKSVFRRLGSQLFLALLFGKFGSVTTVLADQADNLKSLKYSRALEKEADMEGLDLLLKRNIDPQGFTRLFGKLGQLAGGNGPAEMLASHPDIGSRIDYLRKPSARGRAENNPGLAAIFEKLKQQITP